MNNEVLNVQNWDEEIAAIRARTKERDNQAHLIAFYGSSTIRLWKTMQEDLAPLDVINLGFGGSTYADCLYYFDQIFEFVTPETIVLYAGDNDLAHHEDTIVVVDHLEALMTKIRAKYPKEKLAIIGIKPSLQREELFDLVKKANAKIEALAPQFNAIYADSFAALTQGNAIPSKSIYIEDELHLNEDGYKIWTGMVKDVLKQLGY